MASRNRLVAYIAINVLVSALVTLTILSIYHLFFAPRPMPLVAVDSGAGGAVPAAGLLEIRTVSGVGRVDSEMVVVQNAGQASVDLGGWRLQTPDGKTAYTFPRIILHKDGTLRIHTAPGTDTAIDLFWNRSRAAWRSGDLVSLMDSQGVVVDNFLIP
jgi:hypothetical protein